MCVVARRHPLDTVFRGAERNCAGGRGFGHANRAQDETRHPIPLHTPVAEFAEHAATVDTVEGRASKSVSGKDP